MSNDPWLYVWVALTAAFLAIACSPFGRAFWAWAVCMCVFAVVFSMWVAG